MASESEPIQVDSQNSEDEINTESERSCEIVEAIDRQPDAPQTPNKDDSDILVIDEDSPELSNKLNNQLNLSNRPIDSTGKCIPDLELKESNTQVLVKSSSDPQLDPQLDSTATSQCSGDQHQLEQDETGGETRTNMMPELESAVQASEKACGMELVLQGDASGPALQRSVSAPADDSNLNQAALTLLKRLEFKNPGRKQMDYGNFNPEKSEREKKKLRRFQAAKPRGNVCYKEDGVLLDGRDVCDCLNEDCPGCFYPCPQCSSPRCGPVCRSNRKWVYDYIEDEGRNYKVEFPESAVNFEM